jgi:arginine decarboxylase
VSQRSSDFDAAVRLLRGAFLLDHSVSVSELGSLFNREGDAPIQQLKRNVARAYGVGWSFPASCGTSSLNVLGLLAMTTPGSTVLVNRDCHVSVQAAMIHGDLTPAYYVPPYDEALGLLMGPTAHRVARALRDHTHVAAVVITHPNYFGIVGESAAIVDEAHARHIPVLADAAHGAPLHFCSLLPNAAEDLGADVVLQSTHKAMGALNQGSVALFRDDTYLDRFYDAVSQLGIVSTSFSYPVLSSIELAVAQHEVEGEDTWRRAIAEADRFRDLVREIDGVVVYGDEMIGRPGCVEIDRTRVAIDVSGTGCTGYEMERILASEQVYPEMATLRHLLFLFTPGTRDEDTTYLATAIARVAERHAASPRRDLDVALPAMSEMALTPRQAYFAKKTRVAVRDAVGRVSAETIAPYPPGCGVVVAGEVLTQEIVDYLGRVRAAGATLYGASDADFGTVMTLTR